jgi:hypothetical protein
MPAKKISLQSLARPPAHLAPLTVGPWHTATSAPRSPFSHASIKLSLEVAKFRDPQILPKSPHASSGARILRGCCSNPERGRPHRSATFMRLQRAHILSATPEGFAFSDKTETFVDTLGLPRRVDLFSSQALVNASINRKDFLGKHDVNYWRRGGMGFSYPVKDGLLKFHYAATESTNVLGWTFPLRFEWTQCGISSSGESTPLYGGFGKANSIHSAAKPRGLFVPELGQNMVDWRFRDDSKKVNGIIYRSTNAFVSPTNDPILQAHFQAWPKQASKWRRPPQRQIRIAFAALLGLTFVCPLIIYLFQERQHKSTNPKHI